MKITDNAVDAILNVMKQKGLDPKTVFLELAVFEGNLGMGFSRDAMGVKTKHGELTIIISSEVDCADMTIDYGDYQGKKGLIFLGE